MKPDVRAFAVSRAFVWAVIDGLIAGAILALIYNWLSSRLKIIFRRLEDCLP